MLHLKIKTRIVLLSNLIFSLLIFSIIIFLYLTFSITLYHQEENIIKEEADYAAGRISIALKKNEKIDKIQEFIPRNTNLAIYLNDGTIVNVDIEPQIISLEFKDGQTRKINLNNKEILVYDEIIYDKNIILAKIRVSRSLPYINSTLTNIKIAILLSAPLFLGISIIVLISLINEVLVPVDIITKTASTFSEKDLTKRLIIPETDDEIGRLSKTFNQMLSRVENSFQRERQFTSDASHELRTPVTVIRTFADEALKYNKEIKDYRRTIGNILRENKKMDHLISQLLFFARNEENKRNLNIELIDLKIITEDVINAFKNISKNKNIKFSFEYENNLKMKADQLLITSLLMNLIKNAIKFNKKNGLIDIRMSRENDYIKIIIEDTGIGIPEKDLPLIFNRFYKTSDVKNSSGAGIGLSIVKWIVDSHDGSIEVKSSVGYGTIFNIKLPINIKD